MAKPIDPLEASSFALASALHAGCRHVAGFLDGWVKQQVGRAAFSQPWCTEKKDEVEVIVGQLRRAAEWMGSLAKLNGPSDYQAMGAGCRALLEVAIDIVLVTAEPSRVHVVKAWEDSMRLHHASGTHNYLERTGAKPDEEAKALARFYRDNRDRITRVREAQGWKNKQGKPMHPPRWTGRDLGTDTRFADQVGVDFRFEHFYQTRYRELCAMTHGGGQYFRALLDTSMRPFLGARFLDECAKLGLLCGERVMAYLGLSTPEAEAQFRQADETRVRIMYTVNQEARRAVGLQPMDEPDDAPRRAKR